MTKRSARSASRVSASPSVCQARKTISCQSVDTHFTMQVDLRITSRTYP